MEISRISRPAFAATSLESILELFPIRRYASCPEEQLSITEILKYATGSDGLHRELLLAKS
jgi:hypothetical protein